jgi:hypothetical protein
MNNHPLQPPPFLEGWGGVVTVEVCYFLVKRLFQESEKSEKRIYEELRIKN